jgi:N-acetylmuramoyl-L-alanine amidase
MLFVVGSATVESGRAELIDPIGYTYRVFIHSSEPFYKEFADPHDAAVAYVAAANIHYAGYRTLTLLRVYPASEANPRTDYPGYYWLIDVQWSGEAVPRLEPIYASLICPPGSKVTGAYNKCWRPDPPPPPKKKVVVLDPGHGLSCPDIKQPAGAIGVTDFPVNDPPAGRLREDDLTVAFALETERALSGSYRVILTKRDVQSCPSYLERGRIANNANAKAFVSIHVNAPNTASGIELPFANGTSVLYHSSRPPAKTLADQMASSVSLSLGVNNRGSMARDNVAVIKPSVTRATAVLVETARLSGSDEQKLHAASAPARVASGIKTAIDAVIGK